MLPMLFSSHFNIGWAEGVLDGGNNRFREEEFRLRKLLGWRRRFCMEGLIGWQESNLEGENYRAGGGYEDSG